MSRKKFSTIHFYYLQFLLPFDNRFVPWISQFFISNEQLLTDTFGQFVANR